MSRRNVLAFTPYVVASIVHLVALVVLIPHFSTLSKWALMPALLVAVLLIPATRKSILLILAVVVSWAGDILLGMPGDLGFLIGLGAFFVVHLLYLVLFLTRHRARRRVWPIVVSAGWWVALILILGSSLGVLLVPVGIYGLVLGASATAALNCNRWIGAGGVLFLASDTILALKLFYPGFTFWQIDIVIMVLYLLGQGLIVYGATRYRSPGDDRVQLVDR